MATATQWVAGARLRTLPLSVAPVLIGTGAAIALRRGPLPNSRSDGLFYGTGASAGPWGWAEAGRAVLALVVSLALQVAVNYANDYSDGIRGTDDERVGPFRLTGSRAATPAQVKAAAFGCFGVAAVAGLALTIASGRLWLLAVGVACILGAWYYTGGSRPYGYAGLGEISVFAFFGLVAVLGTTYTQAGAISGSALAGAVGIGALACAVLVANNLRDIPTDRLAGKHTLAVRMGEAGTRRFYLALLLVPFVTALLTSLLRSFPSGAHLWPLLALLAVPLALAPARAVRTGAQGLALLPVLRDTGRLALVYAALLAVGLAL